MIDDASLGHLKLQDFGNLIGLGIVSVILNLSQGGTFFFGNQHIEMEHGF